MNRIVLDTNCLIQILPTKSQYRHPQTYFRDAYYRFHLLSHIDQDDDKFVDCAVAAQARYIVTEDSHFSHIKKIPFPLLKVLTLDEFLEAPL